MEHKHTDLVSLDERTQRLERWLRVSVVTWLLTVGLVGAWFVTSPSHAQQTTDAPKMRVSELVVVDKKGIERVRVGGDLPDAFIGGKRVPRGQQAAGVLLYDASGGERSGYVTFEPSGNVGLTLDSKTAQVASLVASAEGNASTFSMWHGKDMIELRSDDEGARLTAVKNGKVVSQDPAIAQLSADMCGAYKEALSRVPAAQVIGDCRRRFTDVACSGCLDKK